MVDARLKRRVVERLARRGADGSFVAGSVASFSSSAFVPLVSPHSCMAPTASTSPWSSSSSYRLPPLFLLLATPAAAAAVPSR